MKLVASGYTAALQSMQPDVPNTTKQFATNMKVWTC